MKKDIKLSLITDKTKKQLSKKKETDTKPISLKERWNLEDCKVTDFCTFR